MGSSGNMNKCTIQILCGGRIQEPAVLEGITLERTRACEPSKLSFTCIKDRGIGEQGWIEDGLSFSEGSQVKFLYGDVEMFFGYVFEKRRNKDHHIEVTCYDQLRYFKNKENYVFTGVRLDQIVTRIAEDLEVPIGSITQTKYVIPKFAMIDTSLMDIINEGIGLTVANTATRYVLYDDYGKLCLKSQDEMMLDLLIDKDTFEDFDYSSTINDNVYNQIVVKRGDGKEPYVLNDYKSQQYWGILQTVVDTQDENNAKELAKLMLDDHCQVARSLSINGHFGDVRVRGGSGVYVDHAMLGDMKPQIQKMWVERVTHHFNHNDHYMDLTLTDGRGFFSE